MKLDNTDPTYGTVAAGQVPDTLYHGTRADLSVGDLLRPGFASNFEDRRPMSWIYMSGLLEAEVFAALQDDVRRVFDEVVQRSGGTINQYQGDGLQALFGHPEG